MSKLFSLKTFILIETVILLIIGVMYYQQNSEISSIEKSIELKKNTHKDYLDKYKEQTKNSEEMAAEAVKAQIIVERTKKLLDECKRNLP